MYIQPLTAFREDLWVRAAGGDAERGVWLLRAAPHPRAVQPLSPLHGEGPRPSAAQRQW